MFVRIAFASVSPFFSRWGRSCLLLTLAVLPCFASCSNSEDTEPFVPSSEGAKQPDGGGSLISEADACDRLRSAALEAYEDLRCTEPDYPDCPAFLRPGGASGCYEYREDSIQACEKAYQDATSCRTLAPCIATAELNTELETCELVDDGMGGAGGAAGASAGGAGGAGAGLGGAAVGGAGGADGEGGAAPVGGAVGSGGDASGGAPAPI